MITDDKNYETYILKQVINNYLDKILSTNEENALNTLLSQCDDLVWKIVTEIYSQSGHKIEFSLVRDVANSRIEPLKIRIADQKVEQARLKARKKAKSIELSARRAEAEEECKRREKAWKAKAEEECKRREEALRVEAERRKAREEARQQSTTEAQIKAIEKALQAENKTGFLESGGDVHIFEMFLKIKEIIIEHLEVESDCVALDSNIFINLGADSVDAMELVMALEDEFNIEISDEIAALYVGYNTSSSNIRELLYYIYEQSLSQK